MAVGHNGVLRYVTLMLLSVSLGVEASRPSPNSASEDQKIHVLNWRPHETKETGTDQTAESTSSEGFHWSAPQTTLSKSWSFPEAITSVQSGSPSFSAEPSTTPHYPDTHNSFVTTSICKFHHGYNYKQYALFELAGNTSGDWTVADDDGALAIPPTTTHSITLTDKLRHSTYTRPLPGGASACPEADASIAWDLRCGGKHGNAQCPGMLCCGEDNVCGSSKEHCKPRKGCQSRYGSCWKADDDAGFLQPFHIIGGSGDSSRCGGCFGAGCFHLLDGQHIPSRFQFPDPRCSFLFGCPPNSTFRDVDDRRKRDDYFTTHNDANRPSGTSSVPSRSACPCPLFQVSPDDDSGLAKPSGSSEIETSKKTGGHVSTAATRIAERATNSTCPEVKASDIPSPDDDQGAAGASPLPMTVTGSATGSTSTGHSQQSNSKNPARVSAAASMLAGTSGAKGDGADGSHYSKRAADPNTANVKTTSRSGHSKIVASATSHHHPSSEPSTKPSRGSNKGASCPINPGVSPDDDQGQDGDLPELSTGTANTKTVNGGKSHSSTKPKPHSKRAAEPSSHTKAKATPSSTARQGRKGGKASGSCPKNPGFSPDDDQGEDGYRPKTTETNKTAGSEAAHGHASASGPSTTALRQDAGRPPSPHPAHPPSSRHRARDDDGVPKDAGPDPPGPADGGFRSSHA